LIPQIHFYTFQAPKRPPTAFFIFSGEKREGLRKAHPDWKVGDIGKELGRLWGNLSDAQKKVYNFFNFILS
jgi:hypothetical protein